MSRWRDASPSPESETAGSRWDSDPVARKTDWTPAASGGANFRAHRLEQVSPLRLEFRPSGMTKLFRVHGTLEEALAE